MEIERYTQYYHTENLSGVIIKYHSQCLDGILSDKIEIKNTNKFVEALKYIKSDTLSEYITFKVLISFSDPDGKNSDYQNRISIYPEKLFNSKLTFRIEDIIDSVINEVVYNNLIYDSSNMKIDTIFIPPLYTSKGVRCKVKTKHIYVDVEGKIKVSDKQDNNTLLDIIQIILSNSIGCNVSKITLSDTECMDIGLNYELNIHNIINSFSKNLPCIKNLPYKLTDIMDSVIEYNKCNVKDIIYMGFDINGININSDNVNFILNFDDPYTSNPHGLSLCNIMDYIEHNIAVKVEKTNEELKGMLNSKLTTNTNYGLIIFPNGILYFIHDYGNIRCEFDNNLANLYMLLPEQIYE